MANKTTIRSLFKAIRHDDPAAVRALIEGDPALVNACALAPPKKDDGQSPLQVALKTGHYAVANYLLDRGANVNFIETVSTNEWRAPALHNAICGAIAWAGYEDGKFADARAVLLRMLALGADPNAIDSYGNSCLGRALLDTSNKLRTHGWRDDDANDIKEVFRALLAHGADPTRSNEMRPSARDFVGEGGPLSEFMAP